jgi:mannitol/fructose-specific phosphotransferase system IIA component (Ntr-type)
MPAQSEPSIKISDLLRPKRILIIKGTEDKDSLIERLVLLISKDNSKLEKDFLLEKITQREQGISTTLDTGLSIPHARIDEIKDFIASLALIPQGIIDTSGQSATIKAMFLFLSPSDARFFQRHLKLLSLLSSMFRPEFINRLSSLKTARQILKEISEYKS